MRKLISSGAALALFFCFSLINLSTADAQISIGPALGCNYPTVATQCAGDCGGNGVITYQYGPLCSAFGSKFCVTNDGSNLCPSHDAIAYVFVNGNFVTSGNITAVGSNVGFKAKCPSQITVVVVPTPNNSGINCVQFGSINFSLRKP